jgi:predicted metal-dependent hydrolase
LPRSRFLLRVVPQETGQDRRHRFLASLKGIGNNLGASVKHPRWTSYGALEVDVFTPSMADFDLFVSALEPLSKVEFAKNLDEPPRFQEKQDVLGDAIRYFNSERYWECHETLEAVWRPAKGQEKALVQGVILVCAAFVHEQRGERDVALAICKRALPQLHWTEERYQGIIDVPRLRQNVERALETGELSPFKI